MCSKWLKSDTAGVHVVCKGLPTGPCERRGADLKIVTNVEEEKFNSPASESRTLKDGQLS